MSSIRSRSVSIAGALELYSGRDVLTVHDPTSGRCLSTLEGGPDPLAWINASPDDYCVDCYSRLDYGTCATCALADTWSEYIKGARV